MSAYMAWGLVVVAAVVCAYLVGGVVAAGRGDGARVRQLLDVLRSAEYVREAAVRTARGEAFARAAEAVAMWPHRIDRRADLARHVDALGSAPDLGADVAPVPDEAPEDTGDDEPATVQAYRQEGIL